MTNPESEHATSPDNAESPGTAAPDIEKPRLATHPSSDALAAVQSHVSTHDIADIHYETGDEVYEKFPHRRKLVIVTILSICSLLAPVSSTSILAAVPQVAETYSTTETIIDLSNALYQVFMGLSPMFFGPLGQTYGRRPTSLIAAVLFTVFSLGTALAPNLSSFFVFRILTAFQGTAFLVIGSSCISDIYAPTERATALAWFLSGTLVGPALGPFIAGVIVTYRSWRVIYWLQTALAGLATALIFLLLPETIHYKKSQELRGLAARAKAAKLWEWMTPMRVLRLYRYPNLCTASFASGALVWNMYSMLSVIVEVLNPRFGLTTPVQSGLFYIAPGCGYLLGTFFGGRWADRTVLKWIAKRNGRRVPEDRLRSCLIALGVVIPGCMLIYGWCVEKRVGGIPVPVIALFSQGVAQLFCFASLNTYCLDVMKSRSAEVIAGSYVARYLFGCIGSAVVLPFVDKYGVGWFSTLSAGILIASAVGLYVTVLFGPEWRESIEQKQERKEASKQHEREERMAA